MRLLLLALVSSLAAVALTAATSSSVAAAPVQPAIIDYHVVADYTWTDPDTQTTYQHYTVTIDFTHGGGSSAAVQANEYAAADDTKLGWDAGGLAPGRPGTDSVSLQLVGGLAHQTVYFKLFLFKPGHLVGKPPGEIKGEVIYQTVKTGTYSN